MLQTTLEHLNLSSTMDMKLHPFACATRSVCTQWSQGELMAQLIRAIVVVICCFNIYRFNNFQSKLITNTLLHTVHLIHITMLFQYYSTLALLTAHLSIDQL